MKNRALLKFRMTVALLLGIFFVLDGLTSFGGQSMTLPWKSVPWMLKALFGLLWLVQFYFLRMQLKSLPSA
jgi:hypothetical protein